MIEILLKAGQALVMVVVVGLVLGAGLPALYAAGMRSLMIGRRVESDGAVVGRTSPVGLVLGVACFAVVVLAICYGILVIVFGNKVLP